MSRSVDQIINHLNEVPEEVLSSEFRQRNVNVVAPNTNIGNSEMEAISDKPTWEKRFDRFVDQAIEEFKQGAHACKQLLKERSSNGEAISDEQFEPEVRSLKDKFLSVLVSIRKWGESVIESGKRIGRKLIDLIYQLLVYWLKSLRLRQLPINALNS